MTAVELQTLSIGYSGRARFRGSRTHTVAADLAASARRGELSVLIGPNGIGKSTLIRTLCGLQPSVSGRIMLGDDDLTALDADQLARRVAVVLTDRVDVGLLSARELVGLGRIPHLGLGGRLTDHDHRIVQWALDAVGADALSDRPAAQLSDGERQRILTARALAQEPDLLVLDEPTAFLDVPSRVALMALLRRLARERNLAVLLSTHDLELALRVADHVWLLHPGGKLVSGTPEELALSGVIGDTFDRGDLRFDAATGVFVLAPATAGAVIRTARVEASQPLRSALERMLGREGYTVTGSGPVDVAVRTEGDHESRVRSGGTVLSVSDLRELGNVVRDLKTDDGLRVADPGRIGEGLERIAAISPYFTITSGPFDAANWQSVAILYSDTAILEKLVSRVGQRISSTERRVSVSTMFLGYAARLWSIVIGLLEREGCVPDLGPTQLYWRDDDGTVELHLAYPDGWEGSDAASFGVRQILEQHLEPLIDAIHRFEPLSRKLLWGNVASALVGAARVLDGGNEGPANDFADTVLALPQLRETTDRQADGSVKRRSCCLYYRLSANYCGDCVLPQADMFNTTEENR